MQFRELPSESNTSPTGILPVGSLPGAPTRSSVSSLFEIEWVTQHRGVFCLVALVLASLALYLAQFNTFQVGTYTDDAHYIVAARGLAAGKGFSLINYSVPVPETSFPPGYSILLMPVAFVVPQTLNAYKIPSILFTIVSLPFWYRVLRRRLAFPLDWLTIAAISTNQFITADATLVMSEAAFLFLTSVWLVVAEGYFEQKRFSPVAALGAALVLIAMFFVRNFGIVYVGVTIVYLLYTRQIRHVLIVFGLFVLAVGLWSAAAAKPTQSPVPAQYQESLVHTPKGSEHESRAEVLIQRAIHNATVYATVTVPHELLFDTSGTGESKSAKAFLSATHTTWLGNWLPLATTILILLGLATALLSRARYAELATVCTATALLLWPWVQARYLDHLIPLMYVFLILGLDLCLQHLPIPRFSVARSHAILSVFLVVVVVFNVALNIHNIRNPVRDRITDISVGTTWIADTTPQNSIVMGEFSVQQSLYTDRTMVDFPHLDQVRTGQYLVEIERQKVNYLIISPPIQSPPTAELDDLASALQQDLREHPDTFQLVYRHSADNVEVYRVINR